VTRAAHRTILLDLLFYTGDKGGIETYVRELYRALGQLDNGCRFVALASREAAAMELDWFPGEVVDSRVSGHIRGLNRVRWSLSELAGVSRWADRLGADLIHCPSMLGPARSRVPTVVTMHDLLYWTHPEHMPSRLMVAPARWMELRAARNATRILTDSLASARDIIRYLRYPEERLHVVPLAGTVRDGARVERRPEPENLVLATGNRLGHKNWAGLIRALPLVDEAVRPRLVITGSKGDDPLRPVVAETGMEKWVDLRSWVSDEELDDLCSRAAAMAIPSFHDGFCLPALEAMMIGLPVLLSDIPVYREVGGDAALYCDPHDLRSIAETLTSVATDPQRMTRASVEGRRRAAEFSWGETARRTLEVFERAMDEPVGS
jgi:glycosyltransferase involved in cell wall biosynthesis